MAKLNFYLRDKNSKNYTAVILYFRYSNVTLKYSTGETIEPKYWNEDTQRAKETRLFPTFAEFNARLNNLTTDVLNEFRKYLNDNEQTPPSLDKFRAILDIKLQKKVEEEKVKPLDLFSFCEQYLIDCETRLNEKTGKPTKPASILVYKQAIRELKNFKNKFYKNKVLDFAQIDYYFYTQYQKYLINDKQFSTNTVGKHIKTLKMFFIEAQARGLMPNFYSKRFKSVSEQTEAIYLNQDEIETIYGLNLANNPRLDRVKDLFVIGCLTGLRFSDFTRIRPENIDGDFIEIETQKTGGAVVIPIHSIVREILEKYDNNLPKAISNQKMNEYLKEIGQLAQLDDIVSKSYTKAGKKVTRTYLKHELITTHSARRSFASNAYKMGMSAISIMGITGHKSEVQFMKYIKITPREHAQKLREMWNAQSFKLKIA